MLILMSSVMELKCLDLRGAALAVNVERTKYWLGAPFVTSIYLRAEIANLAVLAAGFAWYRLSSRQLRDRAAQTQEPSKGSSMCQP